VSPEAQYLDYARFCPRIHGTASEPFSSISSPVSANFANTSDNFSSGLTKTPHHSMDAPGEANTTREKSEGGPYKSPVSSVGGRQI
jgi:hypothetical protein